MNILLTGYSGFIGTYLTSFLLNHGHNVTFLGRHTHRRTVAKCLLWPSAVLSSSSSPHLYRINSGLSNSECLAADPNVGVSQQSHFSWKDDLCSAVEGQDIVIHLAGAPIMAPWTKRYKTELRASRIDTTRALVHAMARAATPPKIFICASAVGIYPPNTNLARDTDATPLGDDFLARLCRDWEFEASQASAYGIRVLSIRLGLVLHPSGGLMKALSLPFRFYLGGHMGDGQQPVSWIRLEDLCRLIAFSIHHPSLSGPINAVSPKSLSFKALCQAYGQSVNRPSWAHIPAFLIRLLFQERAGLFLDGAVVYPQKLLDAGFEFHHLAPF